MPSTVDGFAFVVLAIAVLGGAVAMLSTKNVVHAAFWLLEVSVAAAGVYFLLGADYIALVQLLVYAGAVAVLMIFSIMITLRRREDAIRPRDFSALGALLGVVFCGLMLFLVRGFSVKGWAVPFEIASLVLTAALVGAVWWAREGEE